MQYSQYYSAILCNSMTMSILYNTMNALIFLKFFKLVLMGISRAFPHLTCGAFGAGGFRSLLTFYYLHHTIEKRERETLKWSIINIRGPE